LLKNDTETPPSPLSTLGYARNNRYCCHESDNIFFRLGRKTTLIELHLKAATGFDGAPKHAPQRGQNGFHSGVLAHYSG